MKMTRWFAVAAVLAAAGWTSSAQADAVVDLFVGGAGAGGSNTLVDDNREYLIDRVNTGTRGQIDVGDSIRGIAVWSKINGHALGLGTTNNELTSVFQVKVIGIGDEGQLIFGPDAEFAEAQSLGLGGQAMMVFYEDTTPNAALDYNDPASPLPRLSIDDGTTMMPPSSEDVSVGPYNHEEAFISTGTDGQFFWAIGFTGTMVDGMATAAPGEGWEANMALPTNSVLPFFNTDSGTDVASVNFAVNRLDTTGVDLPLPLMKQVSSIDPNFMVDFNGSATLEGVRNELTPFEISTQSTLTFRLIPLPPAVAMGSCLLAVVCGAHYLRRRQAAAY
jgi:hypothetical protein